MLKILFRAIYKQLLGPLTMSHPLYLHGCKIARFLSMALEGWDYGLKGTSIQALHYLVPNLVPMQVLSLPMNHISLL